MTSTPSELGSLSADRALAERVAHQAGSLLLARAARGPTGVGWKSNPSDLVSDADRAAEQMIVEVLADERPDDGVLGEEGHERAGASGRRWLIDPLDGTRNFLGGYPGWCVTLALEDEQGTLVGVTYDPLRGETFVAERGHGCTRNGVPTALRDRGSLAGALIGTGFAPNPSTRERQARLLATLVSRGAEIRSVGSAALELAWLASGRLDGYVEHGLEPWDSAAGELQVAEAGGLACTLGGEPAAVVAGGPAIVRELEEVLR